jgi:hypothetical protein
MHEQMLLWVNDVCIKTSEDMKGRCSGQINRLEGLTVVAVTTEVQTKEHQHKPTAYLWTSLLSKVTFTNSFIIYFRMCTMYYREWTTKLWLANIFWDITLWNPLNVNRRFNGRYSPHLQGWIDRARRQHESWWPGLEETCSSKMLVDFQRTTRCFILKHSTLHNHGCETSNPTNDGSIKINGDYINSLSTPIVCLMVEPRVLKRWTLSSPRAAFLEYHAMKTY